MAHPVRGKVQMDDASREPRGGTQRVDLRVDVTDRVRLGEPAWIAMTVHLPEVQVLGAEPIVCFAKPGGGYSKEYYTLDLPGPVRGAQAEWHARRGWVFVSVDHLGTGASSTHAHIDLATMTAAAMAAEEQLLEQLVSGTLFEGFLPLTGATVVGIGQSMGGAMTVLQQGRYHCYDGVGILGHGIMHAGPAPYEPAERASNAWPWIARDFPPDAVALNADRVERAVAESSESKRWRFFSDDIDPEIARRDIGETAEAIGNRFGFVGLPEDPGPWRSSTVPRPAVDYLRSPGVTTPEAAAITSPVLLAMGDRDLVAIGDHKGEPRRYFSARSVDLFVCPDMGHMHNFAGTRTLFWQRIDTWAEWVRVSKGSLGADRSTR
jgi:alpha-beta hydrolase superfamily lysophospholipase